MAETLKVLIVDDEPGMRLGVARALRDYTVRLADTNGEVRFTVDTAESGEQAVEKITADPPHILLLDHKLPGISGLDVLDRVVAQAGGVLTIMITAYASLEVAISATRRGAYDFLAKPFTPEELKNAIRKAAGQIILTQQAHRLAQEKRQVRFQFISVLAHELKAPLSAVEGYLRIVKDRSAGDDEGIYDHMLDRCLIRTEHMRKLIADLLDLTRIESGQKKRELISLDLAELARHSIETLGPDAQQRNITVNLNVDSPAHLSGDKSELEIIFNNLISNAIKYNRDGGRVDVSLSAQAGKVTLTVTDTGIGMEEEEVSRLFQDFVRIRNEKTRNILGSGLGLSIVKKLAMLYGGDVTVASKPDQGSTFTVVLEQE